MQLIGNVHLVAGSSEIVPGVLTFLKKSAIGTAGNPDLSIERYQTFGIDDARRLRERAALTPLGQRRVFIIAMSSATAEAQNALLKTLEEPSGNALFVIIHPAPQTLLPTLRSRAQVLKLEGGEGERAIDTSAFIKASPQKRLDILKPLLEKGDDDKRDLGQILSFLGALERELADAPQRSKEGISAVYRARAFVTDRGALVKPLLEQIALLIDET